MDKDALGKLVDDLMVAKDGGASGNHLMVVTNMAKWPSDFVEHRMYSCPAHENDFHKSYKQYPARYIGNYVTKGVKYVGVVAACVHLRRDNPDRVLWKFDDITDGEAIQRAEEVRKKTRRNERPCLVLLQSQLSTTDFEYDQSGGLMGSRIYFDVAGLAVTDVKDLAKKLKLVKWSGLPRRSG